jgi:hypothetical protein
MPPTPLSRQSRRSQRPSANSPLRWNPPHRGNDATVDHLITTAACLYGHFSCPLDRVASLRIRQNELLLGGYSVASKPPKHHTNAGGMLAAVLLIFFKADRALYGRAFLEAPPSFGALLLKLGLLLILRLGRGSGGQKAAVDRQFSAGNETTLIAR